MGGRGLTSAAFWALALASCGDNDGTTTRSGSRLKLTWLDFGGGARLLSTTELWDDERQESCFLRPWTDGNTYCTPPATAVYEYFTSADCTSSGLYVESFERPTYLVHFIDDPDLEDVTVDLLGTPEPTILDEYWVMSDEGCSGPIDGVGRRWYKVKDEIPRSDLVRIRIRESTGDGRVAVRASFTDDGMYAPLAFEDRTLHTGCYLQASSEREAWCIPTDSGEIQYRDASCDEPVLVRATDDDSPVPKGLHQETCSPRVHAVGPETTDAPAFARIDGTCVASADVGARWFELHELPIATVTRARIATAGARLEPIEMRVDGVSVVASQLFDNETGEECVRAAATPSGDYRCVPRNVAFVASMYAEATCTIPVDVGFVLVDTHRVVCTDVLPRYARDFGSGAIMRELLGPRPSPAYWRDGASCIPDTSTSYRIYDLGAVVPDDRWPRGVLAHE